MSDLINELVGAGQEALEVTLDQGYVERLCAFSRTVSHFPTAVKEFQWRNGWFYGLSQAASASSRPDPCPLHTQWLQETGAI